MSRPVRIDPYRQTIRVNPELAEAALLHDRSIELATWLVARKLDALCGDGGGKVPRARLVRVLSLLFECSEQTVRRRIDSGLGIFWREGRPGTLYLCGINQVGAHLGVDQLASKPFMVPLWWFGMGLKTIRALLLGCVAARDGRPVSVAGLAERCGMCERTVQYLMRVLDGCWRREQNFLNVEGDVTDSPRVRRGMRVAGRAVPVTVQRISDSYELPFARRSISRQGRRYRQFLGRDARTMRPRTIAGGSIVYIEEGAGDEIVVQPRKVWSKT